MKRFTIGLLILFTFLLILPQHYSCKKIDLKREVLVKTGQAQEVDFRSAVLNGDITDAGEDNSFAEFGFVYSNSGNPTTEDEKVVAGTNWASGSFSSLIEELSGNTTYYYRSYVRTEDGDIYGNVSSFKTDIIPNADVPSVGTLLVNNITQSSAIAVGEVIDDGGASVTKRGFCISLEPMPTVPDDPSTNNGSGLGEFQHTFINLTPQTEYYVRAYAENQIGIGYGPTIVFTTLESGGPVSEWLMYDDGVNVDGIGLSNGTFFDVAIRFTPEQLAPYAGLPITKFRIFIREDFLVEYYLEIFEGETPGLDELVYEQFVESPIASEWNEIPLDVPYYINASEELYVGYFVANQQPETFPAGIDDGPAVSEYGDLISTTNPISWSTLSGAEIDGNWNIQVFVTSESGEEIPMTRELPQKPNREIHSGAATKITTAKKSAQ